MAVAGPKLRTPIGPSAILKRGKFNRGMSRMKKPSTPPSKSSFSSRVSCDKIESTVRLGFGVAEAGGVCPSDSFAVNTSASTMT
jgi:hypothetical protein